MSTCGRNNGFGHICSISGLHKIKMGCCCPCSPKPRRTRRVTRSSVSDLTEDDIEYYVPGQGNEVTTLMSLPEEEDEEIDEGGGEGGSVEFGTAYTPLFTNGNVGGQAAIIGHTTNSNATSIVHQGMGGDPSVSTAMWNAAAWDGVPYPNPNTATKEDLTAWMFPNLRTMRGLKQVYDANPPFVDVFNPTPAEVDEWNRRVIMHFRNLLGSNAPPLTNDRCLYLRAQWGTERKFTTFWDTKYPATGAFDDAYGPCVGGSNAHCGALFLPDTTDQAAYGSAATPCSIGSGTESISGVDIYIPWATKLSTVIRGFLSTEGLTGHLSSWLGREKVGMALGPLTATSTWRFKFGGLNTPFPP